ncbi:hypothetical protein GS531_03900 [Rhodococcus hoagii]|nr:hypothetical protein [Prescottella equi]
MDEDEARAAYVEARAALLWTEADLSDLDDLAARKVAAWEVEDAVYEEEQHSAVRNSPVARTMALTLKAARIERGLSVEDVVERSGISREVYTAIENLMHSVNVAEMSVLAPVVGLTAVDVLVAGEKAAGELEQPTSR